MKNLTLIFCFLLSAFSLSAIDIDVSTATFKAGEKQYVEVSIFVVGKTLSYKQIDSLRQQGAVEILLLIKQGENIVQAQRYNLNGPITRGMPDFLDLKRFILPKGNYVAEVKATDKNAEEEAVIKTVNFAIDYQGDILQQSEIQLLASFKKATSENVLVKNGYQLEPLAFNFYNKRADRLIFYNEIYHADQAIGSDYLVTYTVHKIVNDKPSKPISIGHKRKKPEPTTVLLLQTDISTLPSGNYELAVEIRNRENELLNRETVAFQRSNPYLEIENMEVTAETINDEFVQRLSPEQVTYSLRAIAVILNDQDGEHLNSLVREGNIEAQRIYLFSYWAEQNPVRPYDAYLEYMAVAQAIDEKFYSGFGYGFETDRGYVYMRYGQPSDMVAENNDPSAPPYEVWSYNDFPETNQNLVKFIFYNPSLSPGNFILLHSTARGEVNNPGWQAEMYRSVPQGGGGSGAGFGNDNNTNFGRNAGRTFTDF